MRSRGTTGIASSTRPSWLRRVPAVAIAALMLLSLAPSLHTGTADVNIDAGPYVLHMHFSELPRPWWNGTPCQFRQSVTVTAGLSDLPAGYAVSTALDHAVLVSTGKSQADGDDMRVVYWDGAAWVELNRTLDPGSAWNDTSTRLWFELHRGITASSSDGDYYLYYGNTSASNPPTNASSGGGVRSLQSGTAVSSSNGVVMVPISAVDTTKAFLMFNARHDSGRPVGSEVRGRIAAPTTLEFVRVTNEAVPVPITIQWYVVEYLSGVKVQRGEVFSQIMPTMDVAINPVADISQAFVIWSKTPGILDVNWSSDDPVIGELTSTSNLQFRVYDTNAGHRIWWQVVEFTNPADVMVQKGSIFTMIGTTTSVNATLSTPVDVNKTFVLVSFTTEGIGPDVGARMLRAQLVNSTTIMIDRSISGWQDNITEISWQAVELNDGSRVLSGTENFGLGVDTKIVPLGTVVDTNRSVAFASVQPTTGQSMGRSPYAGDDVMGVGSVTMALTATNLTMERDNTADEADIGWFVVELGGENPMITLGSEETGANVEIAVNVHHVRPNGSDPQLIVASPVVKIDSETPNPFALAIGTGAVQNFTDSDPRYLRLEIDVVGASDDERFVLVYNSVGQPSRLEVPGNPSGLLYLLDVDTSGIVPVGKRMNTTFGAGGSNMIFHNPGDEMYWYQTLWSLPSVSITSPVQDEHITGAYDTLYSIGPSVVNVSFEYHNGTSWNFLGFDPDVDGVFSWDSCLVGDQVVTLKAIATDLFNGTAEDAVSGVEIDCTPPSIEILQPADHSVVEGNVTITYAVDADAVTVELRFNDGQLHTITTETPPDGTAVWDVGGLELSGAVLMAQAWDEVGLSSADEVVGLSTPEGPPPVNKPPTISSVPDIIVHYDYSYNFDLTPYTQDEDNTTEELTVFTSDSAHIWISPENNLGLVMNYPQSMLNETVQVTIWVTDGIGTGFDVVNVTVSEDYPPEKLRPLPDVSFDEDGTSLNVFFTNLDYYFLDVDGDNLYYSSGNRSVKVRINADRTVDMWAERDWFGFELITIRATDPTGALVEQLIIVQVNPVNDAPVIQPIPEIEVWAGRSYTFDLSAYISDVDSPLTALNISVDSEYVEVSGFNITLKYPKDVKRETITVTVGDGLDSSTGFVMVVVHSETDWFLLWVIMVTALVAVLLWAAYIAHKDQIHVGYLLKEDGSLVREIQVTGKGTVPLEFIIQRTAEEGIEEAHRLDFDKYKVTLIHGKELRLAVVSSWFLSKPIVEKLTAAFEDLDTGEFHKALREGDESSVHGHLEGFEESFHLVAGKRQTGSTLAKGD